MEMKFVVWLFLISSITSTLNEWCLVNCDDSQQTIFTGSTSSPTSESEIPISSTKMASTGQDRARIFVKRSDSPLIDLTKRQKRPSRSNDDGDGPVFFNPKESFSFAQDDFDEHNDDKRNMSNLMNNVLEKLDVLIDLVQRNQERSMHKLEKLELNMQLMGKDFEIIKKEINSLKDPALFKQRQNLTEWLLAKVYNVHEQTYQICKEALLVPRSLDGPCPTMTAVCGLIKLQREKYNQNQDHVKKRSGVVMEYPSDLPYRRPEETEAEMLTEEEDLDEEERKAMKAVLGTVANWTLDQYVGRMHKTVAEELSIFNYNLGEQLQILGEKVDSIHSVLRSNDILSSAMLDVRDQILTDHTILNNIWKRLENEIGIQADFNTSNAICPMAMIHNQTYEQIKALFQEYYNKITGYLNISVSNTEKSFHLEQFINPANTSKHGQIDYVTMDEDFYRNTNGIRSKKQVSSTTTTTTTTTTMVQSKKLSKPEFEPKKRAKDCTSKVNITFPYSCDELKQYGTTCDGVYTVVNDLRLFDSLATSITKDVYCDMSQDRAGWMVILRRGQFAVPKYRLGFDIDFQQYRQGLGDLQRGEFWIGTDFLSDITSVHSYLLQVQLMDDHENYVSFEYEGFTLRDNIFQIKEIRRDRLFGTDPTWDLYAIASELLQHNNTSFYTKENLSKLNDAETEYYHYCASYFRSGWWWYLPFNRTTLNDGSELNNNSNFHLENLCESLNPVQLFAPMIGMEQMYDGKYSYAKWNNWLEQDRKTKRKLAYIMMKIRPHQPAID